MNPSDPIDVKLADIMLIAAVSRIVNKNPNGFKVKLGEDWYELHAYPCEPPEDTENPIQDAEP